MYLWFSSVALTLVLSTGLVVNAAPMNSCSTQGQCIDFTKELVTTNLKCGGVTSEWKICATLDLSNPTCTKDGTVSHTCVKKGDTCNPTSNSFTGSKETVGIASGHKQCQIASPGSSVQFLFKDGNGCSDSYSMGSSATLQASCGPRTSATPSCTGNGIGKECIWIVDVPPAPTPVSVPVAAPVSAPAAALGDPHFVTYDGTRYSYHGECDVVLAKNPTFDSGLGLAIHVRLEIVTTWSLISNAAVSIGEDTFEVVNDETHFFNGVENAIFPITMAGKYEITKATIDSRPTYTIHMHNGEDIVIFINKKMMGVRSSHSLGSVGGMNGMVGRSGVIGRDGTTIIMDTNQIGSEWQVRDDEPMLFHTIRAPQFPQQCKLPQVSVAMVGRRGLRSNDSVINMANEACADISIEMKEFCIEDVIQTEDPSTANTYRGAFTF